MWCLRSVFADFNPRSREGSDHLTRVQLDDNDDFNPRSREGSDLFSRVGFFILSLISIHAPAKGATPTVQYGLTIVLFQSTLPRRERRCPACAGQRLDGYFNPRSREGSDDGNNQRCHIRTISIHAPAKGATGAYYISMTEL